MGGSFTINASSCIINEVMINPLDSDANSEWIELNNPTNKTIDISGWKLQDNHAIDPLLPANSSTSTKIKPAGFVIITDQDTSIRIPPDENQLISHFMVDDNSICNGLGNIGDYLILLDENNTLIDCVEWGVDTKKVPGSPINSPTEGNSIIRMKYTEPHNSTIEFVETIIPTMGKNNIFSKTGSIIIDMMPAYFPKIAKHDTYSNPFSIHIILENFTPNTYYDLKASIIGTNDQYPASQTWTGQHWQYSDRYTHHITTDTLGRWEGWIYLRFSKQYQAYIDQIQNNHDCTLNIKVRNKGIIQETTKNVILLDIDDSTSDGMKGGFIIGTNTQQKILCLKNTLNEVLSCYPCEPNNINDFSPVIKGYYKLSGPVGSNLILKAMTDEGNFITLHSDIIISYGIYHFDAKTNETSFDLNNRSPFSTDIIITNSGDLNDTYFLHIEKTNGFNISLETNELFLQPGQQQKVTLYIEPVSHRLCDLHNGTITIKINSKNDPILQKSLHYSCTIHEPDLCIPQIKTYDTNGFETNHFFEGCIVRVKAYLKNKGNEKANNVTVSYYLDEIDPDTLLLTKNYDTVEQHQKYPSLYWDTHLISAGVHTIIVIADYHDTVKELDEYNNQCNITITILNSTPTTLEKQILITNFYYYAHSTIHNEFITLFNPTNTAVRLDGWYLTNTVSKRITEQRKIMFPKGTMLPANSSITLTQNSTAYYKEQLTNPDYEYNTDANSSIPQLNATHTMYFSNNGGAIALKDSFNHTIDGILYGNTINNYSFWQGSSIPGVRQGEILIRKKENNRFKDTDSNRDWVHPRRYQIGQTMFSLDSLQINGTIIPFISPDNSYRVISSLLKQAESEILLNVYEFTSTKIANILINGLQRNVTINILAEGSPIGGIRQTQQYLFNRLHHHGATIRYSKGNVNDHVYKRYRFIHAKYVIIDQETVIIHSGNFAPTGIPSESSFGNREWGIAMTNKTIAQLYSTVFFTDWSLDHPDIQLFSTQPILQEDKYFISEYYFYGRYHPIINNMSVVEEHCFIQPVLSPDNSLESITAFLSQATESIYIQQLYFYPNWTNTQNPLIPLLINKSNQGVDVKIMLNYNPTYTSTNIENDQTKTILESNEIQVKYLFSNWSLFQNMHNKGAIIDNKSVLISSINWNENSFQENREVGIIVTDPSIAQQYTTVFLSDWKLEEPGTNNKLNIQNLRLQIRKVDANTIYIGVLFTMTFIIVARDWRKRSWL